MRTNFKKHRAWIADHKVACLRDAYRADRRLMDFLEDVSYAGWLAMDSNPDEIGTRIDAFYDDLDGWLEGCR